MKTSSNAEAALLGLCLRSPSGLGKALASGVSAASFDSEVNREIFVAMLEAEKAGRDIDFPSLAVAIPKHQLYLVDVLDKAPTTQNVSYYAHEIRASHWKRQASMALSEVQKMISGLRPFEPIDGVMAKASSVVEAITRGPTTEDKGPKSMQQILDTLLPELEKQMADYKQGKPSGIPTGIKILDNVTAGGLKLGTYNVIAGRPGHGKTTLGINVANVAAKVGYGVAYFTVEMPAHQIAKKFLSLEAKVRGSQINIGALTPEETDRVWTAQRSLYGKQIHIDDSTMASYEAFELGVRKLKRQGSLHVVVLDYIQQFSLEGKHYNRQAVITEISHRVKQLSLELDLAIIVLAQINRDADKEGGMPGLHQIKDSGAIEQDADLALLLHYDEHDQCFINVAKNRFGKDGFAFPIKAELALNAFLNANVNEEAFK